MSIVRTDTCTCTCTCTGQRASVGRHWSRLWSHWRGRRSRALAAWRGCGAPCACDALPRKACARLRTSPKQQPDGMSRLVSLLPRLVLRRQFA